jgi:hypothetical protein
MSVYELQPRFAALFSGLETAFGTGAGRWVKRPPRPEDWVNHLNGHGAGIGIAPLRPDNTVLFAAIDLDEPDFEAAREMQSYIPGVSWIERSRSGNAHVWVFFSEPIEAWVPMGILKEATLAAGKPHVEVFPKNHDFAKVRLGNYINLPYHGSQRPILSNNPHRNFEGEYELEHFITSAEAHKNDPEDWRKKARYLLLNSPEQRESSAQFGEQRMLHVCAEHVISGEAGPLTEGHRNAVFFMLAKCLTNWRDCDHDEALMILRGVNEDLCDPPESDAEIVRILSNVERGQYTSTGCDDPLVVGFAHPNCPIAHPRSR